MIDRSQGALRIVATFERGAALLPADSSWGSFEVFGGEFQRPTAGFLRCGRLVLASRELAMSYRQHGKDLLPENEIHLIDNTLPIGILSENLRIFHLITERRQVQYRILGSD